MLLNKKNILFIIFMIYTSLSYSQEQIWKGLVLTNDSIAIEGATIILYDMEGNIKKYDITNGKGEFSIQAKIDKGNTLKASHLAFKAEEIKVGPQLIKEKLLKSIFVLDLAHEQLNEILIIDENVEKDTVSFDLNKLNLRENDNLREILERIPSFQISDNGAIIYKGKSIDKILINKNPAFIGQNTIALKSVEKRLIEGLEVINNYQDNFELDFDEIEQSVLNIDIKKKYNNILNGSLAINYGYHNKYQIKGLGMYFSENINAFLTHNTNNIGKSDIKTREIKQLFHKDQSLSNYQIENINKLFSKDKNLKKTFLTSSNFTFRKQNQKLKASGVVHYIQPERQKISTENLATVTNSKILNANDLTNYESPSLFGATSLAYKLGKKTILTYDLRANYINSKNNRFSQKRIYQNDALKYSIQTTADNNSEIKAIFNKLSIATKLKKDFILRAGILYSNEKDELINSFFSLNDSTASQSQFQRLKFRQNYWRSKGDLRYRFSNYFIPSIAFSYSQNEDEILGSNGENLNRNINTSLLSLKINGNDLFDNLNYEVSIGLQYKNELEDIYSLENNRYIPIEASLNYDDRLNNYNITYKKDRSLNAIESGLDLIQPFSTVLFGETKNVFQFSTSETLHLSYSHNNLFDGIMYTLKSGFGKINNQLTKGFQRQEGSITFFDYFIAPKNKKLTLSGYFSKTILQLSYPTKIDLSLDYRKINFITKFDSETHIGKSSDYSPKMSLRSITDNLVNFEIGTNMSFKNDVIAEQNINSRKFLGQFLIYLDTDKWNADLSYKYVSNTINNVEFSKHNVNLKASYQWNHFRFSLQGRHLGELFNIWSNKAYNSSFFIQNGLQRTTIENQSLNFLIVGIEYNL